MKTYAALLAWGALVLSSCSLSIPSTNTPVSNTEDLTHDEWVDDLHMNHYGSDGKLVYSEVYTLGLHGNKSEKQRLSPSGTLIFFELYRDEPFDVDGATVWRVTRMKQFLPPRSQLKPVFGKAWGYDIHGNAVIEATYSVPADNGLSDLSGYRFAWFQTHGDSDQQTRQTYDHEVGGDDWYSAYRYEDAGREDWWAATSSMTVSSVPSYGTLTTQEWNSSSHLVTAETQYAGSNALWSRTGHRFLSSTEAKLKDWEYQTTYGHSSSTAPPSPTLGAGESALGHETPSTPFNEAAETTDPLNGMSLPSTAAAKLVVWPSITVPSSWTSDGGSFRLPGPNSGAVAIDYDGDNRPTSVRWNEADRSETRVDLTYDTLGNLLTRHVSYGGDLLLTVTLERDGSSRITRVNTAGPLLKIPLSYVLQYSGASERPRYLTLVAPRDSGDLNLMTLKFSYNASGSAALPFGLAALNFDDLIDSIEVGIGGVSDLLPVLRVEFQAPVVEGSTTTKTANLYDILGKLPSEKELKGTLSWVVDDGQRQSALLWKDGTGVEKWSYKAAWGGYAQLAADAKDQTTAAAPGIETQVSDLLRSVESFDVEKVFQLVNAVEQQASSLQQQYQQSASNLFDQVKTAVQ